MSLTLAHVNLTDGRMRIQLNFVTGEELTFNEGDYKCFAKDFNNFLKKHFVRDKTELIFYEDDTLSIIYKKEEDYF